MVIHDLENINITYSTVSKAELNDFVNSDLYKNLNELPISPWRAQSYGAHPRGEATDIILFLAWTDKTQSKLAAYLGVFPDYFYLNEKKWKVGWLSCMWVDPACRGKGVAKEFMKMAFKSWNGNIAVTEFTPAAEGLYNKTKKFGKLHQSNGLRAYLRAYGAEIITRKKPALKSIKSLFKVADSGFNIFNDLRLSRWESLPDGFTISYPDQLNKSHNDIIEQWNKRMPFAMEKRTAEDIKWIVEYPWIKEGPANEISARYHFTAVATEFKLGLFEINKSEINKEDSNPIALVLYSIKNGELKIPGAWFKQKDAALVIRAIIREMAINKCHTFLLFNPDLCAVLKQGPHPFLHIRNATRKYILSNSVLEEIAELKPENQPWIFQDGDADAGLT